MGCDIHLHTEVKVVGRDEWLHYGSPNSARFYPLFAILAGVRNDPGFHVEAVSQPKGLPSDASTVTKLEADADGDDGHDHSWLDAGDIKEAYKRWEIYREEKNLPGFDYDMDYNVSGFLNGNSWLNRPEWVTDVRWVFWFDN